MILLFYISAAVAVLSTVLVVTRKNAMHALLYLIVSLLAVAIIFLLLGATFAAALEVIIYAGAIMVLFIFAIMMLNLGPASVEQERQWLAPSAWAGPAVLCLVLAGEIVYILAGAGAARVAAAEVSPKDVGIALLGPYVIGVELASLLLLAGLVGAYHLGRRGKDKDSALTG
jgi:NADH-quinone oxidoreductase subunit J